VICYFNFSYDNSDVTAHYICMLKVSYSSTSFQVLHCLELLSHPGRCLGQRGNSEQATH